MSSAWYSLLGPELQTKREPGKKIRAWMTNAAAGQCETETVLLSHFVPQSHLLCAAVFEQMNQ